MNNTCQKDSLFHFLSAKFVVVLVFLLSLCTYAFSQNWIWTTSPLGSCLNLSVTTSPDRTIVVGGAFNSATVVFDTITLVKVPTAMNTIDVVSYDLFIVKYDACGGVIWAKSAAGPGNEQRCFVKTDTAGNVFAGGEFYGSSITFGATTLVNSDSGSSDIFLAKYDSNGNLLWAKSYGSAGDELVNSISADTSGNVLVTGYYSSDSLTFGTIILSNTGIADVFLSKFDANGNILWANSAGGIYGDIANAVCSDIDGNVFITGSYSNSVTFGTIVLNNYGTNTFITKYNSNGNVLWAKSSTGTNTDISKAACVDINGNICVAGYFADAVTFGSVTLNNIGDFDIFIVKYNTNGNLIWAKSAGSIGLDKGISLSPDPFGNVFLVGITVDEHGPITFGTTTFNGGSESDNPLFLVRYDNEGNVSCATSLLYGWSDYDNANVAVDNSGNAYLAIYSIAKYTCENLPSSVLTTPPLCNGTCTGTATVTPLIGTGPYQYSWNTQPVQTTATVSQLCEGRYTVVITNSTGGTETTCVKIEQPAELYLNSVVSPTICGMNTGIVTAVPGGGTPDYFYTWAPSGQTNQVITGLEAGTYSVTVSDANGCTKTDSITVSTVPISLSTSSTPAGCDGNTGTASVISINGTAPFSYLWSTGETTESITGLDIGTYTVTVTDVNNCTNSEVTECKMNDDFVLPTAFSPNNDGFNDLFLLRGWQNCFAGFSIRIFDRWGENVFQSNSPNQSWDGTFDGSPVTQGVYIYYINATATNGKKVDRKGNISLIR